MFGSSERLCDLTKSSNSLNFHDGEGCQDGADMEHGGGGSPGDGYADIRRDPDNDPLLDLSGSKTTQSSKSSLFAKRSINQLNGSIVSLSSQLSKQFRAIEDDEDSNGEEHVGLLENDGSQGSEDAFDTGDTSNVKPGLAGLPEPSLGSRKVDPAVLIQNARPEKPNPPRRPSQQTEV